MKTAFVFVAVLCTPALAFSATIYVPDDYSTIQGAIDASVDGDTIIVKPGTYVENIDFKGKAIKVMSEQGADVTVIDGNQAGSVLIFNNGENQDSILDGFTIQNGSGTIYSTYSLGGGIFCDSSSPTIKSCIITNNIAMGGSSENYGGGILLWYASPEISSCEITDNSASTGGGGINSFGPSTSVITNCLILQNISSYGGGIGGGIGTDLEITNCILAGNTAIHGGGFRCSYDSNAMINNCTFSNNSVSGQGGAIWCGWNETSSPSIINSILWGDHDDEIHAEGTASPTVSYSNIQGGWPGSGNIDADPLFVDPTYGDYHLTYLSPCKDTGDDTAVLEPTDFEGDPRIAWDGTVDMGADEFYTHLYCTGDFTPGGLMEGKFVGLPGTSPVGLLLGSGVLDPSLPTMWGNFHLQVPWRIYPLGPIPGSGILVIPETIPPRQPAPYDLPMQALIGLEADSLTNLYVLEVR
jgi:predicted outer membrane repeat protein